MTRKDGRSPLRYYHGGKRGRSKGDRLLPPDETGVRPLKEWMGRDAPHVRTDRVFFTRDLEVARLFAALCPPRGGAVYEVRPAGDVEPDPDYQGPRRRSFQAPEAVVVDVVDKAVAPLSTARFQELMGGIGG